MGKRVKVTTTISPKHAEILKQLSVPASKLLERAIENQLDIELMSTPLIHRMKVLRELKGDLNK